MSGSGWGYGWGGAAGWPSLAVLVAALLVSHRAVAGPSLPQAQVYTGGGLLSFGCRTLDSIDAHSVVPANLERSRFGGWKARRVAATGFFRVEQIHGRWWAVDPDGYLFTHLALNSIHLDDFTADAIYQMLPAFGFNGTGSWTDDELFESSLKDTTPLAYCPKISFLAEYRRQRNPRIEMPVFDAAFEAYCHSRAQEFARYVDDAHVFGYFSDNELPWRDEGLAAHLAIGNTDDQNHTTALGFLASRGKTASTWDTEDRNAYMALMAERYYRIVSSAIRQVDPSHMYLGSRCHSTEQTIEAFLTNAGKYVDVFSINHYHRWGARRAAIHQMSEWSGRPLLITEFYAMQDLSGDEVGAGWRVLDQPSRGLFYQHYVSTLVETGDVIGWHWFKFQDDANGNKGVVDASGTPYATLLHAMRQMNRQIYDFVDFIDRCPQPKAILRPEADAYFKGPENRGAEAELLVKNSPTAVRRESYLRFDLSTVDTNVASAHVHLASVATGSESGRYQAEWVADNTWQELTITSNNSPPGATVLATWSHGDDVDIDVTDLLREALGGDKKLSLRVISTLNNGSIPAYGSRENPDPVAQPRLEVVSHPTCYRAWAATQGLTERANDEHGDDPDGDGLTNLMEFALGADPLAADAGLYRPRLEHPQRQGDDYLDYVYPRRIDRDDCGLTYSVEGVAALTIPAWRTNGIEEAGTMAIDREFESVTNRVSTGENARRFIQLKVTTR